MAPYTGIGAPFLEQMVARMVAWAKRKTEMAPETPGHPGRRRDVDDLARDVEGELAARTGARSIPRTRRARTRGENTSRRRDTD